MFPSDCLLSVKLELCISVERERGEGRIGWRFGDRREFETVIQQSLKQDGARVDGPGGWMGHVEPTEVGQMMPWCHLSFLFCGSHVPL